MNKLIVIILSLILSFVSSDIAAQYTVYDLSGDITIVRGDSKMKAEKNMSLKSPDYVVIPDGAWIQIHSSFGSKLYKSTEPGTFSVPDIIMNSERAAIDNEHNIHRGIAVSGKRDKKNSVYIDRGVVTRSMEQFDPEASNRNVDPGVMATMLCNLLETSTANAMPVDYDAVVDDNGIKFTVKNIMQSPVYFNVVKIDREKKLILVSELGIPVGNYVLPQGNTLTREGAPSTDPNVSHVIILTYYTFDLDEVLNQANLMLLTGYVTESLPEGIPVFTATIK